MQLLLLKSVSNLGNPGDLVDVKSGYGRNYLVPSGFAIVATPKNVKAFTHQQQLAGGRRKNFLDDMQVVVQEVAKVTLTFTEKVGPQGKLYGAVTNRMVAERLSEQVGTEIDRRKVHLEDPIREPGTTEVEIRLDREVQTVVTVIVEGEQEETPAEESVAVAAPEEEGDSEGEAVSDISGDTDVAETTSEVETES